jgi:hypothetical protein
MVEQRPLLSAEKKRARSRGGKRLIRDVLLTPTTWKAASMALDVVLKIVRVGAKIWEMFG